MLIEKIKEQLKESRAKYKFKRSVYEKILYRVKLFIALVLGRLVASAYIAVLFHTPNTNKSMATSIRRVVWKKLCNQVQLEEYDAYVVNNASDQIKYILFTSETGMSEEIFSSGDYDKRYFDQALKLFPFNQIDKKNLVFFDVGANAGTFTLLAIKSRKFQKHIAIEPHLRTFNQLKINLLLNNHNLNSDSILLYNCAIDPKLTEVEFEICEHSSGDNRVRLNSSTFDNVGENKKIDLYGENLRNVEYVPCRTLQSIVDEVSGNLSDPLFWFWIDVQGSEARVIESLDKSIISQSIFILEVWEYGLNRLGSSINSIAELMKNHYAIMLNFDHPVHKFEFIEGNELTTYLENTGIESFDILFIPKDLLS